MSDFKTRFTRIFKTYKVMDMPSLRKQFDNRSPRSLFRDLTCQGYYSSYTHSGKYYTLQSIPHFNAVGLWLYKGIGFSQYGTLKNTLIQLLDKSEIGKTHDELKKQLCVRVHNALFDLVQSRKISRSYIGSIYVYTSADEHTAKKQLEKRRSLSKKTITLPPEFIQIEVFVEVIRSCRIKIEPAMMSAQLMARGVQVSTEEVEDLFAFYGLKKNWL